MKRGLKKGQVSIFVIMGIIIIVGVISFFVFRGNIGNEDDVDFEVQEVYSFVQECIIQTGEDAIYHIGSTGGYVIPPEKSLLIDFNDGSYEEVAYYLY
jgi:hypothetical protein